MKKILIIEDEQELREALAEALTASGYEVHAVETGERGILEMKDMTPDLVIVDLFTHSVHGVHVLERMRNNPATTNTPAIVLTNIDNETQKQKAAKLGAKYFIKADISLSAVVAEVQSLI